MNTKPFLLLALCICLDGCAEPPSEAPPPCQNWGDLKLVPVSELPEPFTPELVATPGQRQTLEIAGPLDWPAVFVVRGDTGNGKCAGTLVGPQALLTAAHCVGPGRSVQIEFNEKVEEGKCTHAPDYRPNSNKVSEFSADWALCRMKPKFGSIRFERLNSQAGALAEGREMLLTGFGSGPTAGFFVLGRSKIDKLPSGKDNHVRTRGGAVLELGDSGGPLVLLLDGKVDGKRRVVAVNSSRNLNQQVSFFSSVTALKATEFFKKWSADNGTRICGLSPEPSGCRS